VAGALIVALLAGRMWRVGARREAVFAAALLGLSPFFWVYGRVALQETLQALFITLSFILLMGGKESKWDAAGCGLALAMAIAVKPNALTLGAFPLGLTAIAIVWHSALHSDPARWPVVRRRLILHTAFALAGFALGLAFIFVTIVLPHWDRFWPLLMAEGGAHEDGWKYRVKLPGIWLLSTVVRESENWPIQWAISRWSPAISLLAWLYLLGLVSGLRSGLRNLVRSMSLLEVSALAWSIGTALAIGSSFFQPDRRYILLMPGLAMLGGLLLGRCWTGRLTLDRAAPPRRRLAYLYWLVFWFVLLMPAMVILKPWVSGWLMGLLRNVRIGKDTGVDYSTAATLFMGPWFLLFFTLAFFPRPAEHLSRTILTRKVILPLIALAMFYEAGVIGSCLAHAGRTLEAQQAELAKYVAEGETVLGHVASTVFLPQKVRTVRRVSPFEFTPPPNPDIADRLKPRYILEMTGRNYSTCPPYYADLTGRGFHSVHRFAIGPYQAGVPRFRFELFERDPAPAAHFGSQGARP
jgi:hypothetical protein